MSRPPILPHQLAIVDGLRRLGIFVLLSVTAAEARTLSDEDVAALRELGATDALLDDLRGQAQQAPPGRVFSLDFERQAVTIELSLL